MSMKSPGIYIKEKRVFGKSVPTSDTAIPFFIGFTQKGSATDRVIVKEIGSVTDYVNHFGYAQVTVSNEGEVNKTCYLFDSVRLYFANGGGRCYVASVGSFSNAGGNNKLAKLREGLASIEKHPKANLIVVPDAAALSDENRGSFYQEMLIHCAPTEGQFTNTFSIMDATKTLNEYDAETTLNGINEHKEYGAMYHPWLLSTALNNNDIVSSILLMNNVTGLTTYLTAPTDDGAPPANDGAPPANGTFSLTRPDGDTTPLLRFRLNAINGNADAKAKLNELVQKYRELPVPPSGAVAGAFVRSDKQSGIQKAPANVPLRGVKGLQSPVSGKDQEAYNMPATGKSINCIRTLLNNGIRVYGARTLNGGDDDYRYVNVRRTMSMLQQSIKALMEEYVFEDNNQKTWNKMRAALNKFLRQMMNRGVLQGNTPEEAFDFNLGLNETMTNEDLNAGIIKVQVRLALIRPAEFIEITFEQKPMEITPVDASLN